MNFSKLIKLAMAMTDIENVREMLKQKDASIEKVIKSIRTAKDLRDEYNEKTDKVYEVVLWVLENQPHLIDKWVEGIYDDVATAVKEYQDEHKPNHLKVVN